jgi:hypothetical protein
MGGGSVSVVSLDPRFRTRRHAVIAVLPHPSFVPGTTPRTQPGADLAMLRLAAPLPRDIEPATLGSGLCIVGLLGTVMAMHLNLQFGKSSWATWYERLLGNAVPFTALTVVAVFIGGLVQIIPTVMVNTAGSIEGVRQIPYTPLELVGRNIYVREGCYNCHSQMIRPLRDEVERYGHYSLAAESMYDRPFQWGSKRTGPDLARVGGKYSDDWHRDHLNSPKSVVPGTPATPAASAARRDDTLSPMTSIASGGGPTNTTPLSLIARAKSVFSEKNP